MCTNPVTRHLSVAASAIGTIDRLSDGRAVFGIGTGDSALRNIGVRPARVAEIEAYLVGLRDLFRSGEASFNGSHIHVQGLRRRVPTFVTAEGPRMLRLAGALADGVVLHCGASAAAMSWNLAAIREGALAAGRDPDAIEVWMMLKTSIGHSRSEALRGISMGLAASAHHAFRGDLSRKAIPADLLPAVTELIRRYDPAHHEIALGRNAALSDELGLTDFLADTFGLVGTPAECIDRLHALESLGVHGVILPALGNDPRALLERIGSDIIPAMRPR
jgi:5,10-methylenetetrahydromethanopterin reductase